MAIVDDHEVFANALALFLGTKPGITVVGQAHDGASAVDLALFEDAQVVLMDVGLPRMDGLEATRRLLAIKPDARVIVISGQTAEEGREAAIHAGAVDFLTKGGLHDQVLDAIYRAIARAADGAPPADGARY